MSLLVTSLVLAMAGAPEGGVSLAGGTVDRAVRLVAAQADLPAPPPPPPLVAPEASQRMTTLQNEIDDLSNQLLKLPSRFWPSYSVVLTVLGSLTLAGGLVVALLTASFGLPVLGIAIAVGGLALLVVGIATGVSTVGTADAARERILERREALELELRTLRRQSTGPSEPMLLEVARF
jgi:hypothetical protein